MEKNIQNLSKLSNIFFSILLIVLLIITFFISYNIKINNKKLYIEFNGEQVVTYNGVEIDINKNMVFTLQKDNNYNVIKIHNGKIACIEANCPNNDCVHSGYIDGNYDNEIICCIPHGLIIYFN